MPDTRSESSANEVKSVAQKLPANTHSPVKVMPAAVSSGSQRPVFLSFLNMLSDELIININEKWDACWPINRLRPLVLLDLISYLLFIKELKKRQLLTRMIIEIPGNHIRAKEFDELSWDDFKDMGAQSMHELFTKEKGLPDLIKNYSETRLHHSLFLKAPLLLTPTSIMLANVMGIIKIMEAEDASTGAAIFEYLINKAEITAPNGQVYAPDYVVKLVTALMQPSAEDLIGDPSAGNGSFLVNSAMYIANKNAAAIPNFKTDFVAKMFKGIESDLIQLRIGAMNMILHGIEDPTLESLDVFNKINLSIREQPTLILSNLFFEGIEDKIVADLSPSKTDTRRQEIRFLNFILKNLKTGGRSAVIVRDIILYDKLTEIKTIRQQIIDEHKLEAVISLPARTGSAFSGACILIFTNSGTNTTDKIWFYKMESGKQEINNVNLNIINTYKNDLRPYTGQHEGVTDIITRWKNLKEEASRKRTEKSFYVPVDEIRTNNYNLVFNEYRKVLKEFEPSIHKEVANLYVKKDTANTISEKTTAHIKNLKSPEKSVGVIKKFKTIFLLLLIFCVGLALYFIYFRNSSDNKNATDAPIKNAATRAKIVPVPSNNKSIRNRLTTKKLSSKQIKDILQDTTGFIRFPKKEVLSPYMEDPQKPLVKNSNAIIPADKIFKSVAPGDVLNIQYAVVDTAYFHDKPEKNMHRKSFLDPANKNTLTPLRDENGFIFIKYTNRFGITSKGWIDKHDLSPVK